MERTAWTDERLDDAFAQLRDEMRDFRTETREDFRQMRDEFRELRREMLQTKLFVLGGYVTMLAAVVGLNV